MTEANGHSEVGEYSGHQASTRHGENVTLRRRKGTHFETGEEKEVAKDRRKIERLEMILIFSENVGPSMSEVDAGGLGSQVG